MESFKEILSHKNLKASSARLMILEKLSQQQAHYSAEDLFLSLKPVLPGLSLATIYKNLEDMRQAGLLRLVNSANQIKKYEWERGDHFHLVSDDSIKDLDNPELFDKVKKVIEEGLGDSFSISGLDIQIFGKQNKTT